ncbi:hypothetical protein FNF27_02419 [Cafeteria roenbergensis]|uniref:Anaphase-promoting complex subunit 2 n=1 Tax=Cafeteria roenbergensis TaxID=33653 RepID=A0A5A8EH47_CAFRO|nr:hypothetical protein FNF27_02419 [Cafeteria roenbergensis]
MLVMRQAVKVATVTRMERALDCVARSLSAIDAKQVPSAALRRGLSSGPAGGEDAHGGETGAVERGPTLGAAVAAAMDGLEALGECRLCLEPGLGDGPADAFAGAAARQAGSLAAVTEAAAAAVGWVIGEACSAAAVALVEDEDSDEDEDEDEDASRDGGDGGHRWEGASALCSAAMPRSLLLAMSSAGDASVMATHSSRSAALFDLVASFPGSRPALLDLRATLGALPADAATGTAASFAKALQRRLLQPGAATSTIVQVLLAASRSLRCVDPSGVLLGAATAPVRAYLGRDRPDAVKRVVEMLMTPASAPRDAGAGGAGGGRVEDSAAEGGQDEDDDDEDDKEEDEEEEANPLRQELEAARSGPRASMPGPDDTDSEDEEEEVGPHGVVSSADTGAAGHRSDEPVLPWKPPSLVAEAWQHGASRGAPADRTASGRRRRRILASALLPTGELGGVAPAPPLTLSDILADDASLGAVEEDSADLLWGIITVLGGPAPLVKAYDERLATALLSSGKAWDVEELVTTHELIKTRLGEREVLSAEVMLKDLSDSRRIAATIRSTRANPPARRGVAPAPAPVAPAEGAVHPAPAASLPGAGEAAALARAGARAGVDESDDESVAGTPLSPATASARRAERAVFDGSPLPLPRALVLSRLFWPGLAGYGGEAPTARPPPTVLHPRLRHGLGKYTSDFETAKAPRKLTWLSHLGSVCVDVALPGRDKPVEASGTLAQVSALLFVADAAAGAASVSHHRIADSAASSGAPGAEPAGLLSVASLSRLMNVPLPEATRLLRYWERKGVLDGSGEAGSATFGPALPPKPEAASADGEGREGCLAAGSAESAAAAGADDDDDGEEDGEDALAAAVRMQQELLVRQFAVGMLRSHGSMPLQRVLSMLRSFSPYSGSEADLRAAMNKLVAEGVLTRTGDAYELA